jgi:hypothetical protein
MMRMKKYTKEISEEPVQVARFFRTSEHLVKQIADEFSDEKSTHRKKKQKMLL